MSMTRDEFQAQIKNHDESDWSESARLYHSLYYGRNSQFRKVLNQMLQVDMSAAIGAQRLAEIQVACGTHRSWLVNHHMSKGARHAAENARWYLNCTVDDLPHKIVEAKLPAITDFAGKVDSRLCAATWGLSAAGYPEFAERWIEWKNRYCDGIRKAHSLTRHLKGIEKVRERLHLCIDSLKDNLPELRGIFRDAREVTGSEVGWWADPSVVKFLDETD